MSLALLASGTLVGDPERRISSAGREYTTVLLRVPGEEESCLVSLVAFSVSIAEALLAHHRGDQIAVTGKAKLRTWIGRDGVETKGIGLMVEGLLTPYQLGQRRQRVRRSADGEREGARRTAAAELGRIARTQAAEGRAQVLTAEPEAAGALATMRDEVPF